MTQDLQDDIVRQLLSEQPDGFDRIEVNLEIDTIDGDLVLSPDGDIYMNGQAEQIRLSIDLRGLFKKLRTYMTSVHPNTPAWTVCDLSVDQDGAYIFRFSYGAPPRLTKLAG